MPLLVPYGNELIRINPANNKIECSTNRGVNWNYRYSRSYCGTFRDLIPYGGNLLALTDKGVYYSNNKGASWIAKYTGPYAKTFAALQDSGRELLATTIDGHLYCSTNEGASWIRRK